MEHFKELDDKFDKEIVKLRLLELRNMLRDDFAHSFDIGAGQEISSLCKKYKLSGYWRQICNED